MTAKRRYLRTAAQIKEAYQKNNTKLNVFTEVCYFASKNRTLAEFHKIMCGLSMAVDFDETWWHIKESLTLEQWCDVLIRIFDIYGEELKKRVSTDR